MKLSYNWLNEYISLAGVTPEQVGEKLTLHTCELEETLDQAQGYKHVVVGELKDIKSHPKAEKLSIAQMDCGEHGAKQIIFGQVHEVSLGDKLPVALPGAKLNSGIEIEESDIRGQKSEGMITDNQELGMKNPELLRFDSSVKNGSTLMEVCPEFGDVLLDIDNKSLTHRPDLMGHVGFVRELKAIYKKSGGFDVPENLSEDNPTVEVDVQTDVCRRFTAVALDNVSVAFSDMKTMVRLEQIGVRCISNMVDITNLVMLGYGQPMHVFDADKIEGKLIIRQAKEGETLLALDGEEYELSPLDTVVADEKKVLSIAGIMGGMDSGVTMDTKNIVFECANWDPVAVRKTSTRLGLRSDSSMRYEKSLDPENCAPALALAIKMSQECAPDAKMRGGMTDVYPNPWEARKLSLDLQLVRDRLGIDISNEDQVAILSSLDFEVVRNDGVAEVVVPSFRDTKDVEIAQDLMEEIVRMYGFDNVPVSLPPLSSHPPKENHLRSLEWNLRDFWSQAGYLEAKHYGYVADTDPFLDTDNVVKIANPLSSETTFMRQTLLSGMMKELESEVRMHREVSVFELGKTYMPTGDVLPVEELFLGVLRSSTEQVEKDLFFEIKADLEQVFYQLGVKVDFEQGAKAVWAHPGRSTQIVLDGENLGELFVLHPSYKTCEAAVVFAEVNVQKLLAVWKGLEFSYVAPSPFPPVRRDISFVVPDRTAAGDIEKSFRALEGVESVALFDEFSDAEKIGVGKKNLAYHITLRSHSATLDESVIDATMSKLSRILKEEFGAEVR